MHALSRAIPLALVLACAILLGTELGADPAGESRPGHADAGGWRATVAWLAAASVLASFVLGLAVARWRASCAARRAHGAPATLHEVSECLPLGFMLVEASGRCAFASQGIERVTGRDATWHAGRDWDAWLADDERARLAEGWGVALVAGCPREADVEHSLPSGRRVRLSLKRSRGDGGVWAASIEDVTEDRQRRDELEAAWRGARSAVAARHQFLANVSHEIRTPMTAIVGFADLLAERAGVDRELVEGIRRNAQHLLSIINDILDLAKSESSQATLVRAPVRVAAIAREVAAMLEASARAKGLALEVCLRGPVPRAALADATRLRQVLINLVGNAIKFTDRGAVTIAVAFGPARATGPEAPAGGGILRVNVSDTGVGLTRDALARIFEPFAQGDESMSRRYGGTGLGLAISRNLVRLMGGTIAVKSEPGRGSTFTVVLPVEVDAGAGQDEDGAGAPPAPVEPPAEHADEVGLHGRILLVEDGPDNRRLISHVLSRAGATVDEAVDGREGAARVLEALGADAPYALILLDMQMPVQDGYATARELRARGVRTPIIALTAHALPEDRAKCLGAGCDDYAAKPIDRRALVRACAHWMGRAGREAA